MTVDCIQLCCQSQLRCKDVSLQGRAQGQCCHARKLSSDSLFQVAIVQFLLPGSSAWWPQNNVAHMMLWVPFRVPAAGFASALAVRSPVTVLPENE